MLAGWLVAVVLMLLPGVAAGQTTTQPIQPGANQSTAPAQRRALPGQLIPPSPADAEILVNPRTPPSATIPSGPDVITPLPAGLETPRPLKTFEFHPILGIS